MIRHSQHSFDNIPCFMKYLQELCSPNNDVNVEYQNIIKMMDDKTLGVSRLNNVSLISN